MIRINTSDLEVGYGKKTIIKNINIDIQKGEIVALIGPNGAGKSTVLKSITKQLKRISGDIKILDADIDNIHQTELARTMAYVSTDRISVDMTSCYDIVSQGRYPYTNKFGTLGVEDRAEIEKALKMVNAYDLRNEDFSRISDGQKQKIKLAMAICQKPDIIVLDEPTSFLDIKHKIEILEILKDMADSGMTVVMSLHELELVRIIADKVICVDKGEVIKFAGIEEVFTLDFISRLYHIEKNIFSEYSDKLGLRLAK